jgi:ABC-type uncharacterized transport system involved in gliding motility auxiliary subunit
MRLFDLTSPVGFLAIVGAWIAHWQGKQVPGGPEAWSVAGAALILAHVLLRWEDIVRSVGGRQIRYGSNMLALTLVVCGILGVVNYLVFRHSKRWDLTKNQRFSLSEQSRKVVANLKDDVKALYFQETANMDSGQERLKQYQSLSPRFKVEFVDPIKSPAKAREYDISLVPTIILQRGEKREKITGESEQDITNALIKVTRNAKKTVCFVEGQGERDPEDSEDKGFSRLKTGLVTSGYDVKKVLLLREGKVPADCSVVVVGGPAKDPLPSVVDALRNYVKAGGRAIVMVEPEFKESYAQLTGLLKEWNIETGNDLVVDGSLKSQLAGAGLETPLAARYSFHEITRGFRIGTIFHTARSVQAGKETPQGVSAQNLVETGEASWAQSDLKAIHEQGPQKADRMGPISVVAVATVRGPEPEPTPPPSPSPAASPAASPAPTPSPAEKPPTPEGRVIAFGDADFASNMLLRLPVGNKDFILNAVAWLTEETDLISIRPKESDDQRMVLTGSQGALVLLLSIVALPGVFVVLGIAAWWVRR